MSPESDSCGIIDWVQSFRLNFGTCTELQVWGLSVALTISYLILPVAALFVVHVAAMKTALKSHYRHSHLVVAHRLGGTEAPENTFAALMHAIESKYRVSFDTI